MNPMTGIVIAALQQPTTTSQVPAVSSVSPVQTTDGTPWPPPGVFMPTPGSGVVAPVALTNPTPRMPPDPRRSVYGFIDRANPDEVLNTFDVATDDDDGQASRDDGADSRRCS